MKKMRLWDAVRQSPEYADIAHDDNLIASEVHARLSSRMGRELLLQQEPRSLQDRFRKWSQRFWKGIQKSFAKVTGKSFLSRMDARDFIQAPVSDLLLRKNLSRSLRQ